MILLAIVSLAALVLAIRDSEDAVMSTPPLCVGISVTDDAVELLDVYSQQCPERARESFGAIAQALGTSDDAYALARTAWYSVIGRGDVYESAAIAAQCIRDGWRP